MKRITGHLFGAAIFCLCLSVFGAVSGCKPCSSVDKYKGFYIGEMVIHINTGEIVRVESIKNRDRCGGGDGSGVSYRVHFKDGSVIREGAIAFKSK